MRLKVRGLWMLAPIAMSLAGCATVSELRFEQSNQLFMERTIASLDLAAALEGKMSPPSKLCLVSMESPDTEDLPLVAEIEDQLVAKLCSLGYSVLERDEDLVRRMIRERSADSFRWIRFPSDIVSSSSGAALGVAPFGMVSGAWSAGRTIVSGAGADTVVALPTQLTGADVVVAYRILECGLVYRKGVDRGHKTREGLVRLHVRASAANTGQVILAQTIQATYSDQVPVGDVSGLSAFYYSFYPSNMPLQRGAPAGYREVGGTAASEPAPPNPDAPR